MAHRLARKRAFELFNEGLFPPDVSGMLNISIRSCQRWYRDFLGKDKDVLTENLKEIVAPSSESFEEIVAVNLMENSTEQPRTLNDTDWFNFAKTLVSDHFCAHNEVRTKIQRILNQKLDETDLNLRSIHTLSLSLTRHIEGERVAASLEYLDVNRAALRLEATGLVVSDPTADAHEVEEEE